MSNCCRVYLPKCYVFILFLYFLNFAGNYSAAVSVLEVDISGNKLVVDNESAIDSNSASASESGTDEEDDYSASDEYNLVDSPEPKVFNLSENANDIKFLLFRDARNENSSKELILGDYSSIERSGFNRLQNIVFLIHGFTSNSSRGMAVIIKRAYLQAGTSNNIIVVDWGKLSTPEPNELFHYPVAYPIIVKRNVPIVYNRVADFIQFLIQGRYTTVDKIHIVGHSLGAHISGGVGNVIATNGMNGGRKLTRITGLDPAGFLFQGVAVQRKLNKNDAAFVDVYHTARGTLGTLRGSLGHADFFPNGGRHQPGCVEAGQTMPADFGVSCSHSFASFIYAASITKNITACRCDPTFIDFVIGLSMCPGNCQVSVLAGEQCPSSAEGQFYFRTSKDPFDDQPSNGKDQHGIIHELS